MNTMAYYDLSQKNEGGVTETSPQRKLRGTSQDGDRYSSLTEDTLPETKINFRLGVYR